MVTFSLCGNSYLILAPALMTAEKDPKIAAAKCFDSIGLDPDSYRIGHTKASFLFSSNIPLDLILYLKERILHDHCLVFPEFRQPFCCH